MSEESPERPNVWVIYDDGRKDTEIAGKYGRLRNMFTGFVHWDMVVYQTRKMFQNRYKQGDYLVIVGDPKLVAIVVTVAEKYFSEDGTVNLLCWSKKEQEYFPETYKFPDIEDGPAEVSYQATQRLRM